MFDKAQASPEPDPSRPITGRGYKVWADEPTGTLCKVSTLSGTVMGFVGVGSNHPWFHREDCPLPGISSYGSISHPAECKGLWWFYFTLPGESKKDVEKAMQKCRTLAAQLEVEGTELAQQISQLSLLKKAGSEDDGDDEIMHDTKIRNTLNVWKNCNPSPWVTPSTGDSKAWENCTLTTFPTLGNSDKAGEFKRAFPPRSAEYSRAYEDLMECIQEEIAKYASDDELEAIVKYMDAN